MPVILIQSNDTDPGLHMGNRGCIMEKFASVITGKQEFRHRSVLRN